MSLYLGNKKVCPVIKVGTVNNQNKTINENGTYTADEGYTGLGEVTVNVPSRQPAITELNITPTTSTQTITPPSGTDGYAPINVAAVTSSIDNNIVAGNIKKDVTILGVTGTLETGTTPTGTLNINANGTYNVTNYASANVNVSGGGGGIGITREVSAAGVYQRPPSNFTFSLPSNATDVGDYALAKAFYMCPSLTSVDLSSLTTVSGVSALEQAFCYVKVKKGDSVSSLTSVDLSSLTTVSGVSALSRAFYYCTSLTSVDLSRLDTVSGSGALEQAFQYCTSLTSVDLSSLTTVSGNQALKNAFADCKGLTEVLFTNLETIGTNSSATNCEQFSYCFYNCYNLTSIIFPKLEKIYCTGGASGYYGTFSDNDEVEKMYFPKLDTITYGLGATTANQNACKNVFYGCSSLTELHFAAANQAAIEASPGYSTAWGRGAGNVTIYFDL